MELSSDSLKKENTDRFDFDKIVDICMVEPLHVKIYS